MHLTQALLARGEQVVGVDNLNDYYDPVLKQARLAQLQAYSAFTFERMDITHQARFSALLARLRPTRIVHLAAQVGVRYSMTQPQAFIDANLSGFLNVLEAARHLQHEGSSPIWSMPPAPVCMGPTARFLSRSKTEWTRP